MTLNTKALKHAAMVALLLTVGIATGWSATQEEDRARGEELLRKARLDLNEADHLLGNAANAALIAKADQVIAERKRLQAHNLEREAFLLIRDAKRMEAAELRARAEAQAQQVKSEQAELERLQGLLTNESKVAADTTSAAGKLQDAATAAQAPAEKAELAKMTEALNAQATAATNEAATLQHRMVPVQAEINRLKASIAELNQKAQRLAPGGI